MNVPLVASREEWLGARKQLLAKEKEFTRARDALSAERRRLPMVAVDKEYVFQGPAGKASLLDLFEGRRQLIVYHAMFDPSWDEGCNACSVLIDGIGRLAHSAMTTAEIAYMLLTTTPTRSTAYRPALHAGQLAGS